MNSAPRRGARLRIRIRFPLLVLASTFATLSLLSASGAAHPGTDDATPPPGYFLADAITVPVNGSSVASHIVLETGVGYKLRATRSFVIGGPGFADAEWAFNSAHGGLQDRCAGGNPVDLGIGINDIVNDTQKSPAWGPFDSEHIYNIDFNGSGAAIGLNYHDCSYSDNSGSLTVRIFAPEGTPITPAIGQSIGTCGGFDMGAHSASSCDSDPVNSLSGAFTTHEMDLEVPGVGVPLSWRRSYTSIDTTSGRQGPGWVDSLAASLAIDSEGNVVARLETGQRLSFAKGAGDTFTGGPGVTASLAKTASSYELTLQDQTKHTFDLAGKLQSKVDRNGKGLTLAYNGQGRLATVTDAASRQLTLTYNPAGLLSQVAAGGRDVDYTYDAEGRLETVTDVRGKVWTYTYDGPTSRLAGLRNPLGHFVYRNTYDATSGRVTEQLDPLGNPTTFAWNASTETSTVTDPAGKQWVSDYDQSVLVESRDPIGHTTQHSYDANGFPATIRDARGNTTAMTHDSRGNMLTRTAPAPLSFVEEWRYNARNDVSSYKDRRGNTTDFGYDANGNLTTVTGPDPDGAGPLARPVTTYTRDPATGLVTAIRKPKQHGQAAPKETVFEYDPAGTGNVLSQTTPEGNKTTLGYDAAGRVTSKIEPRGNVSGCNCAGQFTWDYEYDAAGHRTQELSPDPDGAGPLPRRATTFTYDDVGRLQTVTNAKGKVTRYEYNAANERTKEIAPNLSEVRAEYDSRGNLTAEVDQLGKRTTYGYDDANRRTSMVDPRGNEIPSDPTAFTWTYGYDQNGNLTSVVSPDPDGAGAGPLTPSVTFYGYDALNRRTFINDPLDNLTVQTFDGNGNLTRLERPDPDDVGPLLPNVTRYDYDALNRLTVVTDGEFKQTSFAYDQNGNRVAQTTPRGTTRYTFDADDRLKTTIEARENVAGCNCPGRHTWTYAYDPAAHLVSATSPDPDGSGSLTASTTQFTYDRVGQRESRTDALGRTVRWTYDELGQLTKVTTPDAKDTLYAYDPQTNDLVSRTDALGRQTRFGYDLAHRRTSFVRAFGTPLASTWTYAYDAAGNQVEVVDARANSRANPTLGTTSYSYDPLGRRTGIDYSDAAPDVLFAYDNAGNRTAMSDGAGQETYTYDNANRLSTVTRGPDTFSYAYDRRDLVTRRAYPDGTAVDLTYADDGLLQSVTSGGLTTSYAYDAAGNQTEATLPSTNNHVELRTYDNAGRLTDLRNRRGRSGSTLSRYTLVLDKVGNPTQVTKTDSAVETYKYDVNDRITEACFRTSCTQTSHPFVRWTYDAVGNRLTETRTGNVVTNYTHNALHQLTQRGTTSYTYDENGNEVSAGNRTFSWNTAGQLVTSTQAGATVTYTYDGESKRLSASTGAAPNQTTRSLWDRNASLPMLALERDGGGALLRRYVIGNDVVSMSTPAGAFYLHYDYLGSTTNVSSATGATQWTWAWEPFGVKRTEQKNVASAPTAPLQYTGEYLDQTTGLYNLRARQYDPTPGRFLSYDPLEQSVGDAAVSPYAYVENRPTVLVDPWGLCGWKDPLDCAGEGLDVAGEIVGGALEAGEYLVVDPVRAVVEDPLGAYKRFVECFVLPGGLIRCAYDAASAFWQEVEACASSLYDYTDLRTATRRCAKVILPFAAGGLAGVGLKAAGALRLGRLATVGRATSLNYRATFFAAYPELRGKVVVHHAVERQILKLYPGLFTPEEIHSLQNLRGIPISENPAVHLSAIRKSWNTFYKTHPAATREQVLAHAAAIDRQFGSGFRPPR